VKNLRTKILRVRRDPLCKRRSEVSVQLRPFAFRFTASVLPSAPSDLPDEPIYAQPNAGALEADGPIDRESRRSGRLHNELKQDN
jgi:hypothetical protein